MPEGRIAHRLEAEQATITARTLVTLEALLKVTGLA